MSPPCGQSLVYVETFAFLSKPGPLRGQLCVPGSSPVPPDPGIPPPFGPSYFLTGGGGGIRNEGNVMSATLLKLPYQFNYNIIIKKMQMLPDLDQTQPERVDSRAVLRCVEVNAKRHF